MSTLTVRHLTKRFTGTDVLRGINLEIQSGEFFSILGPSGCGKTTLLRLIAGFEEPTSGSLLLDGRDITRVPAQHRGIAMVFQNYALFPHMTVSQNVAFGLETQRLPGKEIRERVKGALELIRLTDKADVRVPQLSGGEQQRVAVARALVVRPALLLFDEPLSNLDVALRQKTREEIRSLQRQTRITSIYVTHDQAEAMSLSDRVAVMRSGTFEQVGTPEETYQCPASTFVAQFLGGANILEGKLEGKKFRAGSFAMDIPAGLTLPRPGRAVLAIKPEAVALALRSSRRGTTGTIQEREYLGFTTSFVIRVNSIALHVSALSSAATQQMTPGRKVAVEIDWTRCTLFADGGS